MFKNVLRAIFLYYLLTKGKITLIFQVRRRGKRAENSAFESSSLASKGIQIKLMINCKHKNSCNIGDIYLLTYEKWIES